MYINFFSYKPTKVISDFILNYLKKVIGGATTQKIFKTNTKSLISSIWICPQRPQGCQKNPQDPLNTPFEVWCAKIAPQLEEYLKNSKKTVFFDIFFSVLMIFQSLCLLGVILVQELNSFIFLTPLGPLGGVSI